MRLSTDEDRDKERALRTIAAAVEAGITVFDTAHAYGLGESELGHNERLLARALRDSGAEASARVVTKGGMTRAGGGWIPDGRAKAIRSDCEASLEALDGLPDRPLPHPRTRSADAVANIGARPGSTRGRGPRAARRARKRQPPPARRGARARPRRRGPGRAQPLRRHRAQRRSRRPLRRAGDRRDRPLSARRAAQSGSARPTADARLRGGGTRRDRGRGRARLVAGARPSGHPHSRARGARRPRAPPRARRHSSSRPKTERSSTRRSARRVLLVHHGGARRRRRDVVVVMGVPGAGKSRVAEEYAARGYLRLNRDERGGTLRELAGALDEELGSGTRRVVLDNTYLTRAARSHVIESGVTTSSPGAVHLARYAARAGTDQRSSSGCSNVSALSRLRRSCGHAHVSRACSRRPLRCARSASSSRRPPTRAGRPSSRSPSPASRPRARGRASSSRQPH